MRKLAFGLVMFAVSTAFTGAVTVATASASPTSNGTCSGGFLAAGSYANITALFGCAIDSSATVLGNVTIASGGSFAVDEYLDWRNQSNNAGAITVVDSTVHGNVQVQGSSAGVALGSASIDGNVQLQNNSGGIFVAASTITGNLQVQSNSVLPTVISLNTVSGSIQVQNNTGNGSLSLNSAGGNCQSQNTTQIGGAFNTARGSNSCNS